MPFEIETYETAEGKIPFDEYMNSLSDKMKAKVLRDLELLAEFGTSLREPYSSSLGDGIFELRSKQGSDISRSLYFFVVGRKIILTHGFIKKQQKTPPKEIEKAKRYREDWTRRHENEI